MPFADVLVRYPELVSDTGTAHHRPGLINQKQLAVITIEVAKAAAPAQTVVPAQLHASRDQALAKAEGEGQGAVVIEQATHLYAAFGGIHQYLHHGLGTGARLYQVQLQIDLLLGPHNSGEHARKKFGAVDQ
ncbi:hypothetical protein D3C80_1720370 [compost metagenome]